MSIYSGYSAKLNGNLLFDTSGYYSSTHYDYDKSYGVKSGKVRLVLDGVSSASFSLPSYNVNSANIEIGDEIVIYQAPRATALQDILIGYVSSIERDEVGNVDVSVTGYNGILKYITHTYNGQTKDNLYSALYWICKYAGDKCGKFFYPSSWSRRTFEATFKYSSPNVTAFEEFENIIDQANTLFTSSTIHYWQTLVTSSIYLFFCTEADMATCEQTVEFGKNIKSIKFYNEQPEYNVIKVFGKDTSGNELSFTGWNDQTNVVACEDTYLKGCIWSDRTFNLGSGFSDAAVFQKAAQNLIDKRGKVKTLYQITAIDLGYNRDVEHFSIGKKVRVISEKHGIDATLPITELVIDICNPLNTLISVGGTQPRITR